jgi:propionyl-CoA carboxylase beta chain
MKVLITTLVDEGEFLEIHALYAPNIIVGFARIEGESIGIIANQPSQLAGTLDINSSEKAARFLRFCDAFNIPILTLVDVPGFMPGIEQEWNGIIRRGAKLLYAYAEASVPLVTLITRKAYGGAFIVMGSKYLGSDINFAWPSAEIAVMGAQGAVNILYRKELADAKDPEKARAELVSDYTETLSNPYAAAERGTIDSVIEPHQSRAYITKAFRTLKTKRDTLPARKHGNIPL